MQFAVPQFTEVEDKLIGPLTLKQFLILMAAGGVIMFFYSLLKLSIFFFFFAVPIGILGLAMAFGKFNGRPLYGYSGAFISFVAKPQVRIFKREEPDVAISFKAEKQAPQAQTRPVEPDVSSLRKIAVLLDQKTAEEKELIDQ